MSTITIILLFTDFGKLIWGEKEASQKDVEKINYQFNLMNKRYEEYTIPDINSEIKDSGLGLVFVIKFIPQIEYRRKYIFDIGDSEYRNRVSLFIDPNDIFVFELIDNAGEIYNIKISEYDFIFNKFMILLCEYGVGEEFSYMRVFINSNLIIQNKFNFKINLSKITESNFSLAADITGKNNGALEVAYIIIRSMTLGATGRNSYFQHLNDRYAIFK